MSRILRLCLAILTFTDVVGSVAAQDAVPTDSKELVASTPPMVSSSAVLTTSNHSSLLRLKPIQVPPSILALLD